MKIKKIMARTKLLPKKKRPTSVDFTSVRVAATKEIARKRRVHTKNVKIKKLLSQAKQIEVKKNGQVVRRMTVRRKAIYLPTKANHHRTY